MFNRDDQFLDEERSGVPLKSISRVFTIFTLASLAGSVYRNFDTVSDVYNIPIELANTQLFSSDEAQGFKNTGGPNTPVFEEITGTNFWIGIGGYGSEQLKKINPIAGTICEVKNAKWQFLLYSQRNKEKEDCDSISRWDRRQVIEAAHDANFSGTLKINMEDGTSFIQQIKPIEFVPNP